MTHAGDAQTRKRRLGGAHGSDVVSTWMLSRDAFTPVVATVGIFAIATVKVRYVILDFMELRHAPLVVRVAFEAWPLLVTSLVLAYYLAT